jgi:hypothetical protein|tara:strand:- start:572 stop:733 length:162 start_codon:yes stop_codon:yes gene_type:complete
MTYYRGIKQTPENTAKEKKVAQGGIYRGVKHEPISSKSLQASQGIYRGVKWTR